MFICTRIILYDFDLETYLDRPEFLQAYKDPIKEESYTQNYMAGKLFKIMNMKSKDAIYANLKVKPKWIKKMYANSKIEAPIVESAQKLCTKENKFRAC